MKNLFKHFPLTALGEHLQDASELASVLEEAAGLSVKDSDALRRVISSAVARSVITPAKDRASEIMARVKAAEPLGASAIGIDAW